MVKRKFGEIRDILLKEISKGKITINKLSTETNVNWKTCDNHLIYLMGKGLVTEVFSSEYVRIFELTDKGREYVTMLKFTRS